MSEEFDGWVSGDRMWAAIPWGDKKYISIHKGQQICVHHSLDTAKQFIQKQTRKRK